MEKRDEDHSSQLANGPKDGSTCLHDNKFCRLHRDRRHHIKTTFVFNQELLHYIMLVNADPQLL